MSEGKSITLLKAAKELNIGIGTAVDFLVKNGYDIEPKPGTKLDSETYNVLLREFQGDKIVKEEANQIIIGKIRREESSAEPVMPKPQRDQETEEILIKNTGVFTPDHRPAAGPEKSRDRGSEGAEEKPHVGGMKIVGKIDLDNLRGGRPHPQKEYKAEEEKPKPAPKEPEEKAEPTVERPSVEPSESPQVEQDPEVKVPVSEEKPQTPPVASSEAEKPAASSSDAPKAPSREPQNEVIRARAQRLTGPNVVGRIDLAAHQPKEKPVASSSGASGVSAHDHKRKRKRKDKSNAPQQRPGVNAGSQGGGKGRPDFKGKPRHAAETREEPSEKEIQDQIKATLARLSGAGKSSKFAQRPKLRRQKRDDNGQSEQQAALEQQMMSKLWKVTEFVTATVLPTMMGVPVTQTNATRMSLGLLVSINHRLDADAIAIEADE